MIDAGWYDWFCTDRGLYGRLKAMMPAVRRIAKSDRVDVDTMYVFFKNNCPGWVETTYDDFRICELYTGDVLYTIIPRFPAGHLNPRGPRGTPIKWCSEVWDNHTPESELQGHYIENLAQGKPIDHIRTVVLGTRKEMYGYFGV